MDSRTSPIQQALHQLKVERTSLSERVRKLDDAIGSLTALDAEVNGNGSALFSRVPNVGMERERKRSIPSKLLEDVTEFVTRQTAEYSITDLREYLQGERNYTKEQAGYDVAQAMRDLEKSGVIRVTRRGMGRRPAIYAAFEQ